MKHQKQYQLITNNRELANENLTLDDDVCDIENHEYAQDEQWLSKHVLENYVDDDN